jgi:hypothetical protein
MNSKEQPMNRSEPSQHRDPQPVVADPAATCDEVQGHASLLEGLLGTALGTIPTAPAQPAAAAGSADVVISVQRYGGGAGINPS